MVASRGPVPKRSEMRRRTNKEDAPITRGKASTNTTCPQSSPDWHPVARDWYMSLIESGQSYWYEPSDWATAVYVATAMSNSLFPSGAKPMSSMMFAAVMAAMNELLTTEGARRRVRMELVREAPKEDAAVLAIAEYKKVLGA